MELLEYVGVMRISKYGSRAKVLRKSTDGQTQWFAQVSRHFSSSIFHSTVR
jgi:hypothetical protein